MQPVAESTVLRRAATARMVAAMLGLCGVPAMLMAQQSGAGAATPSTGLAAPSVSASAKSIPLRSLSETVASDSSTLMSVSGIRSIPGGRVIVNDAVRRQLVVFERSLAKFTVIADTSTNSPNSYGLRSSNGGLVPYRGDSTLFIDSESQAFLVIDERGRFARIMAPTRASDLSMIAAGIYGVAAFDPQGRMVYRTVRRSPQQMFSQLPAEGKSMIIPEPDSAPILRTDFDARTVDTILIIKAAVTKGLLTAMQGGFSIYRMINPLPAGDDWTMLPDGTIAIVRNQDYHIDWLAPDGTLTSSPKMPFDWKPITVEEKRAIVDSVKRADEERRAKLPPPPPPPPGQPVFRMPTGLVVDATDLPDFYPPVRDGQVRADPSGNVWILPSTSAQAKDGLLFDVVNRNGEIVERVQLPAGRTLVGFADGNTVYMNHIRAPGKSTLERATIVRR